MQRLRNSVLIIALVGSVATLSFGQDLPPPDPPKKRPPVPIRLPAPVTGELSVVTTPANAHVTIKDEQDNLVDEGDSIDGKYEKTLRPGRYKVVVKADKYLPKSFDAQVKKSAKEVIPVQLPHAFGSIEIRLDFLGPDATVLIDDQKPPALTRKADNRIQIDDIPVGSHTLRITHPTIASYEEKLDIIGGIIRFSAPQFQRAMSSLLVKSQAGAEIYIDGAMVGRVQDNGELRLPDRYKPGQHTIRAEKSFFEPTEEIKNLGIGESIVELNLSRIKSSPEFGETFLEGLKFWDAPSAWQVVRRNLIVKGSEAGLVQNQRWVDFKMQFDVSFTNGKGAVWIIRARDKKNYYLFQLCGAKGSRPRTFRSYLYQNGRQTILKSDPILEDLSRVDELYTITVEAKGPTIRHSIQLRSKPALGSQVISTLTDSSFLYGGLGFQAIEGEEFVVIYINVLPEKTNSR